MSAGNDKSIISGDEPFLKWRNTMNKNYGLSSFLAENRSHILERWRRELKDSGEINGPSLTAFVAGITANHDLLQLLTTSFVTGNVDEEISGAIVNRLRLPEVSIGSFLSERSILLSTILHLATDKQGNELDSQEITRLCLQLQHLVDDILNKTAVIYEHVVENGGRSFCQVDTEGIIKYVNPALLDLIGDKEIIGLPLVSLFEEQHHADIEKALLPVPGASPSLRALTIRSADNVQISVGTELAPIIVEGVHKGGYASMVNITDSVKGTYQLMEHSPLGILKINTDLDIVYTNTRARDLVGAQTDMRGESIEKLFPPGINLEILRRELRRRFEEGLASEYPAEIQHQQEDRLVPVMIAATPERNADGTIIGSMAIIRSRETEQAIQNINDFIVTCPTTDELLEQVSREVRNICSYELITILEYSKNLGHLRCIYTFPKEQQQDSQRIRWWIMPQSVQEWQSSRAGDDIQDLEEFLSRPEWAKLRGIPELEMFLQRGLHSVMRFPIWDLDEDNNSRLVATISLYRHGKGAFSAKEKEQLSMLPLEKAVLAAIHLEEKKRITFRFTLFREILNACDNMQTAADLITSQIANFYQWNNVSIFRIDEKAKVFRLLSQKALANNPAFLLPDDYTQPLDEGIMGRVWHTATRIFSGDVKNDPSIQGDYLDIYKRETNSELCMPLKAKEKIFWVMNIEDPQVNAFSSDEIEELEVLHDEMTAVLGRAFEYHLLHETLRHSSDGILVTDCMWRVIRSNPAFKRLLGYGETELHGVSLQALFEDPEIIESLQAGKEFPGKEVTMLRRSGATREVLLSSAKLPPEVGGTILVLKDLSILKKMEELDYLGKLYYEIAIQTKTPLSLLFSWLKRLKGDISNERKDNILASAMQQLRKLTLTYDRLALYDKETGLVPYNPVLFDIGEVLEIVQQELPAMEWSRIVLEWASDVPLVRGDMFQIVFCLESILSYLLRSAGEHTKVRIDAGCANDMVFLKIRGNVPEIPEEATGGRAQSAARISETLADMALGEKVIETFIANHEGHYSSFRNGSEMEFNIELKSSSKRSLI